MTVAPLSPQLRVAVTPFCNLHCFYCRPEGEGWAHDPRGGLGRADIAFLIEQAVVVGFRCVKFTGGEPLLRADCVDLVRDARRCPRIEDVQMVTNGTLLSRHARALRDAGLDTLTVSLDAATPQAFRDVRGGDLSRVIAGLEACAEAALPVRINMVVTRRNLTEIPGVLNIARRFGASLKLLDLVNLTAPEGDDTWFADFVPFSELRALLEELGARLHGLEPPPGGLGAPLLDYRLADGHQVVVKDSLQGQYYNEGCRPCPKFPCQDALISLRVTHDGHLKKCLVRDDNLVPLAQFVKSRHVQAARETLAALFADIVAATFHPNAWRPPARSQ